MTNSISYALTLYNTAGKSITGNLSYSLKTDQITTPEKQNIASAATETTTQVSIFPITGTLELPELTGEASTPINGQAYVSEMGPTIASMITAQIGMKILSMEFNFIDSAGKNIGGGLNWQAEPMQAGEAWCVLGARK